MTIRRRRVRDNRRRCYRDQFLHGHCGGLFAPLRRSFTDNYRIDCDTRKARTQEEESRAITDRYGNGYYGGRSSRGVPPANIRDDVGGSARRRQLAIAKFSVCPEDMLFLKAQGSHRADQMCWQWRRKVGQVGADATRRRQLRCR